MTVKKVDRAEQFIEITRSLCPVCNRLIDAELQVRSHKVFMHKRCPEHGWFDTLVSGDSQHYFSSLKYNKPGTLPNYFASEVHNGCPEDCGLCPEHKQHTCLGIIEITDACNLRCPTCFADACGESFLSKEQVGDMLDLFVKCEGEPEVLQLSGGEPTLHPELFEILNIAKSKGIKVVQLNTNGVRIAQDSEFTERLAEIKPAIYLQFDGFSDDIYRHLRGIDLLAIKMKAIEYLTEKGFTIVLAVTVVKGINDHQLGKIADFAIRHPAIRGVLFQPVTYTGRFSAVDPLDRMTLPDVLQGLESQSKRLLLKSDFVPIPCPHPTCSAVTYVYTDNEQITPITRIINVDDYLDYFKNQIITDLTPLTKGALEGLWSASATPGTEKATIDVACACGLPMLDLGELEQQITMIGVHAFMDPYNFDLKRARKCCIHQILPSGKMVPFCVYNNLKRGC
jgi:uncharacterized radical SAM superfamily Fe-S cluster-containing enzyme